MGGMHETGVGWLIDRNLCERASDEMAGQCRVHGVNPAITQAPAKFAVEFLRRAVMPEERPQTCSFGGVSRGSLLEFARDDGQRVCSHAPVEGGAARKLWQRVFLEELADGGDEFGGRRLVHHGWESFS